MTSLFYEFALYLRGVLDPQHDDERISFLVEDETNCSNITLGPCTFRVANGTIVVLICVLGTVLNIYEIYILMWKLKLSAQQNTFIVSVAVTDLRLSVAGLIRG